ncbi:MAG: thiamine diphosphokinase [Clostridia bacterium]|nr:thiamine diphosphokinase [Clostridia bacterium]
MRCIIFSGADIFDYDYVASHIDSSDFIICADSGIRHAEKLGLCADIFIGDFDSADEIDQKKYNEIITLPCEKDDTDTFAAAKIAVEKGADEAIIFGAIGSRMDHTLGNISTLEFLHNEGISARIINEKNEIGIIKNETVTIEKRENSFLSLIPLDEMVSLVSISGVKYPLENATIYRNKTLAISNEFYDDVAKISVNDGTLLYIISKD